MQSRDEIRLTMLASSAGPAVEIAAGVLAEILRPVRAQHHPNLLADITPGDAVTAYKLSEHLALLQTANIFAPVVDDPFIYGEIVAASAMGDLYALGGEITFGFSIAAWPDDIPAALLSNVLAGSTSKMAEVGAIIAGAQIVTDENPKYGLCVTGTIDPGRLLTKTGAQVGDRLYLTKAIGTGVVLTALQREAADPAHFDEAVTSMLRLNRLASRLAQEVGVSACTSIGRLGLVGHAAKMAEQGGVRLQIAVEAVPFLSGAIEYAELGLIPASVGRNRDQFLTSGTNVVSEPEELRQSLSDLLHDAQTSGGLLLSIPVARAAALEAAFARAKAALWPIGEVIAGSGVEIIL